MVAHRTLTPFVRVRILHPLPKAACRFRQAAFFICREALEPEHKFKSVHEVPQALRGFESFIRCQRQLAGSGRLPFLFYGLQRPQGEYPAATASSRVENQTRLSSDILAADGQKGIWNLSDLLLAV